MRAVVAAVVLLAGCAASERPAREPDVTRESRDGDIVVRLVIERATIQAADSVALRLEAEAPEDRQLRFPSLEGPLDDFLLASSDISPARLIDGGRVAIAGSYELDPLKTGELTLPALAVGHWGPDETEQDAKWIETEPETVNVESLFTDDEEVELRDIAEPQAMPIPLWWWLVLGGSLLAVGGLAYWLWKQRRRRPPAPELVTPPNEIALAEIDRLVAQDLIAAGRHKMFFLRLSEILRRYIEGRFGLHAPERTTEEFLQELQPERSFSPEHKDVLRDFLTHADLVKFAEYEPSRESGEEAATLCRRFVNETAPPPSAFEPLTKDARQASLE